MGNLKTINLRTMFADTIYRWREREGLDYDGWFKFLVKDTVRKTPLLKYCLPIYVAQEDYDSGLQWLAIVEWGYIRFEVYQWPAHRDHEICSRLWSKLSSRAMYHLIRSEARLMKSAKTWKEVRHYGG